ncbi:MAG: glycosyltransferase [Acidobacteriia bacterium]|nr:glycosyltransferase [Terriglobia bacterium]
MNRASIVICTCNRAEALDRLLASILRQQSGLAFEIIVVDNHPASGSTAELKTKFPQVRWIEEPRSGVSFARNAGVRAATSEVVVFVDDDMEVSPGWLDAIVGPIFMQSCDVVLGTVSPVRVESEAERLFEAYGAHGHQRSPARFDASWLRRRGWSLPLWQVGGIGNSAIRRSLFDDHRVGLFEEALGGGSPAGSWEDLYLLYRLLRADRIILREPAASVKHAHRDTMDALARQLCEYRRGEVCFCLLVLFRHRDPRALFHLWLWIPAWRANLFVAELGRRFRGQRLFPLRLMLREWSGYASGPVALIASMRRAARLRARAPH